MPSDIILIRPRFGAMLKPATGFDEEQIQTLPVDKPMRAVITFPRSVKQHRFFFGLLKIVVDNQEHYRTVDALRWWLAIRLGHVDELVTHHGEVTIRPKSISFSKMDGRAFGEFLNGCIDVIIEEILPGAKRSELVQAVEAMVSIRWREVTENLTE